MCASSVTARERVEETGRQADTKPGGGDHVKNCVCRKTNHILITTQAKSGAGVASQKQIKP